MILLIVLIIILILFIAAVRWAYGFIFYSPKGDQNDDLKVVLSPEYHFLIPTVTQMIKDLNAIPYEPVSITSFDGLKLNGRYYHVRDGAPLNICFHGYRGTPSRDFSGGAMVIMNRGHNLLLIEERAQKTSEGHTVTFGINERIDCLDWVNYSIERFGEDIKIILVGISMGAATVLMASDLDLPPNVKGIIADCPYSSPLAIIQSVGTRMHLPGRIVKWLAICAAEVFGHFDITVSSPVDSVTRAKVPILLIHGESDDYVPVEMSYEIRDANPGLITLHTFPNAGHGISFMLDPDRYTALVNDFAKSVTEEV